MSYQHTAGIADLEALVQALPEAMQRTFARIFRVSTAVGELDPPPSMSGWIENHFGSVEAVRRQRIVKVTNVVTWEGALFNTLRARRPLEAWAPWDVAEAAMEQRDDDPFCHPLEGTPEDVFGRVEGHHAITASNVAKYDALHGVLIFDHHNPLVFDEEHVLDYVDTAFAWARKAHASDPQARYFFLLWNCLWKAGASIVHGHMQMTLARDMHYARVEELRRDALAYRQEHGRNYFADLFAVHETLGLAFRWRDVGVITYLTPVKEQETLLLADTLTDNLKRTLYRVLQIFLSRLQVTSFNVALYLPPLVLTGEDWSGFPAIFRVVDRGDPMYRTCDIGAMELYASPVIGTDPFYAATQLREGFKVV